MEILTEMFEYGFYGFVSLILLLIAIASLFGKRVRKKWEFEADFRDAEGREFGEFEIELSMIEKEEADYTLKAKFAMRHPALTQYATVQVYIDKTLVLEKMVETAGRLYVRQAAPVNRVTSVSEGQSCRVFVGSTEIATAEFHPD